MNAEHQKAILVDQRIDLKSNELKKILFPKLVLPEELGFYIEFTRKTDRPKIHNITLSVYDVFGNLLADKITIDSFHRQLNCGLNRNSIQKPNKASYLLILADCHVLMSLKVNEEKKSNVVRGAR